MLMAALWCVDETNVLPLFLFAAAVHEIGHILVLYLAGGRVHKLILTACGAVLRCALPQNRFACAAICLAGPAASFALTALAGACDAYRLAGASALLGIFNLLPMPPLDGGMVLFHLADGRFPGVRYAFSLVTACALMLTGSQLWKCGGGCWLLLIGMAISAQTVKKLANHVQRV